MSESDLKPFEGKWENFKNENLVDTLEAMGVGLIKRQAAGKLKPTLLIKVNGTTITVTRKLPVKEFTQSTTLGETAEKETADGDKVQNTTTFEGGKLVAKNKPLSKDLKPFTVTQEVKGDQLIMTMSVDGAGKTATRYFKKA